MLPCKRPFIAAEWHRHHIVLHLQHRKLSKEELEVMAERLSRVEKREKKEPKAHPMQLKYEFDRKSRKYTERYIRAKKASTAD